MTNDDKDDIEELSQIGVTRSAKSDEIMDSLKRIRIRKIEEKKETSTDKTQPKERKEVLAKSTVKKEWLLKQLEEMKKNPPKKRSRVDSIEIKDSKKEKKKETVWDHFNELMTKGFDILDQSIKRNYHTLNELTLGSPMETPTLNYVVFVLRKMLEQRRIKSIQIKNVIQTGREDIDWRITGKPKLVLIPQYINGGKVGQFILNVILTSGKKKCGFVLNSLIGFDPKVGTSLVSKNATRASMDFIRNPSSESFFSLLKIFFARRVNLFFFSSSE